MAIEETTSHFIGLSMVEIHGAYLEPNLSEARVQREARISNVFNVTLASRSIQRDLRVS